MDSKQILILAGHENGKLNVPVFELVSLGLSLAGENRSSVGLVLFGHLPDKLPEEVARKTGLDVLTLTHPALSLYNGEAVTGLLEPVIRELNPTHVLVAHTSQGLDYAPGLAVRLSAGCLTGINGHAKNKRGESLFCRAICGGNFTAKIRSDSPLTVLTVQQGSFAHDDYIGPPGRVFTRNVSVECQCIISLSRTKSGTSTSKLGDAKIIVSAGRGIGEKKNLNLVHRFAALFPHSAVGGSRPLIDIGWLEYPSQVGITGAVVAPEVYIACGISGSTQHIAGMRGAKFVVSINTDPHAAIFNESDVCIIDDVIGFLETVVELMGL